MPIAHVTVVGPTPVHLAQRLATALAAALDAPPGHTWVRITRIDPDDYAEDVPTTVAPVFVELLRKAWPADDAARASSLRAVTDAVAAACERPASTVHVIAEAPAEGRVSFGGRFVAAEPHGLATTGAKWESIVGYSRAVRAGDLIFVTGTTALTPDGGHIDADDAYGQARQCLVNLQRALAQLGADTHHVVRTRMFVTDIARDWESIGRAHAEVFHAIRPATSMVEVRALIEPWMRVEIEADAVAG